MKSNSLDALIRLKRFEVEGKRRKVADIEATISDFNYVAAELDRQIATEEDRAGVFDVGYYAYPTFAKLAIQRRANLAASAAGLGISSLAPVGNSTKLVRSLRRLS